MCWKSKAQCSVTLSSTEYEWIALSEVTKEIIFVLQLLESLGIKVNLPNMQTLVQNNAILKPFTYTTRVVNQSKVDSIRYKICSTIAGASPLELDIVLRDRKEIQMKEGR